MNYFLDTEFNDFGGELISLALVREDGVRELYLAAPCSAPAAWVAENVMPIIDAPGAKPRMMTRGEFGYWIASFLRDDPCPNIVSDWPDDIRYFCQALITGPGQMVSIPALSFDLRRVDAYPTDLPGAVQHNALWDARALRHYFGSRQSRSATTNAAGGSEGGEQ